MLFNVVWSIVGCACIFVSLIVLWLAEIYVADFQNDLLSSTLGQKSTLTKNATAAQVYHKNLTDTMALLDGFIILLWITSTILFGL